MKCAIIRFPSAVTFQIHLTYFELKKDFVEIQSYQVTLILELKILFCIILSGNNSRNIYFCVKKNKKKTTFHLNLLKNN